MRDDDERALRKFPATFRNEVAAICAGAMNGGLISPRRHGGLLVEVDRAKRRYDAKIATLRARGPSAAIDKAESEIAKIAADLVSTLVEEKSA